MKHTDGNNAFPKLQSSALLAWILCHAPRPNLQAKLASKEDGSSARRIAERECLPSKRDHGRQRPTKQASNNIWVATAGRAASIIRRQLWRALALVCAVIRRVQKSTYLNLGTRVDESPDDVDDDELPLLRSNNAAGEHEVPDDADRELPARNGTRVTDIDQRIQSGQRLGINPFLHTMAVGRNVLPSGVEIAHSAVCPNNKNQAPSGVGIREHWR